LVDYFRSFLGYRRERRVSRPAACINDFLTYFPGSPQQSSQLSGFGIDWAACLCRSYILAALQTAGITVSGDNALVHSNLVENFAGCPNSQPTGTSLILDGRSSLPV
jgi:hypothetical protein